MEETLGKRIAANRKRLGITQDRLAEQLGVTAQAVSKWENDQSCPDITMLPKLAEIFGVSTDVLLGMAPPEKEKVFESEIVAEQEDDTQENDGLHFQNGQWEFRWDTGKQDSVGLAVWVLLVGGLMLANSLLHWQIGIWDILWPAGLLVFGLFGLFPKFSFFRLGCSFFGAYFLLSNLHVLNFSFGKELLLPVLLLIFGASLLVDAFRKPRKGGVTVHRKGKNGESQSNFQVDGETFLCNASFGEDSKYIDLPRLSYGKAEVSFGELHVDLSGCKEISDNCRIDASCSFGELILLVPRRYRVEASSSTAFASVDFSGHPDDAPAGVIYLEGNVSFGDIAIRYI